MLEQPIGDDDLVRHAALQRRMKTPLCLDESLTVRREELSVRRRTHLQS